MHYMSSIEDCIVVLGYQGINRHYSIDKERNACVSKLLKDMEVNYRVNK